MFTVLALGGCAGDRCADVVPAGAVSSATLTAPQRADASYDVSFRLAPDARPTVPLVLRGRGGEKRVHAVLDTGASSAMVIGARLARLGEPLGPVTVSHGVTGPFRTCFARFESITGLGGDWSDPVITVNLDRCDEHALVGMDFFDGVRGFILDPESKRLIVLSGSDGAGEDFLPDHDWSWTPWRPALTATGARRPLDGGLTLETELTVEAGRPVVMVHIGGEPVPCVVDTGAAGLLLPDGAELPGRTRPSRIHGHAGPLPGRTGRLDGVELAGLRFDNVRAASFDADRAPAAERRQLGVLGMDVLGRQAVWFDLEGQRLGLARRIEGGQGGDGPAPP